MGRWNWEKGTKNGFIGEVTLSKWDRSTSKRAFCFLDWVVQCVQTWKIERVDGGQFGKD